jgi:hypothetical protein
MARPERFELPTLWFEARAAQNLSAFSGVAYEPETPFRLSQLSVDCPQIVVHRQRLPDDGEDAPKSEVRSIPVRNLTVLRRSVPGRASSCVHLGGRSNSQRTGNRCYSSGGQARSCHDTRRGQRRHCRSTNHRESRETDTPALLPAVSSGLRLRRGRKCVHRLRRSRRRQPDGLSFTVQDACPGLAMLPT